MDEACGHCGKEAVCMVFECEACADFYTATLLARVAKLEAAARELLTANAESWTGGDATVRAYEAEAKLRAILDKRCPLEVAGLKPHRMDAPNGPECRCGKPSRHESGWCGACQLDDGGDRGA